MTLKSDYGSPSSVLVKSASTGKPTAGLDLVPWASVAALRARWHLRLLPVGAIGVGKTDKVTEHIPRGQGRLDCQRGPSERMQWIDVHLHDKRQMAIQHQVSGSVINADLLSSSETMARQGIDFESKTILFQTREWPIFWS
jgi:hypothetical protein